jgi:isochorismate pyruvate lyase
MSLQCNSMEEVRENIDNIDQNIVELIAKRGAFVSQAAKFKKDKQDVKAPKRVEEVISKVLTYAKKSNANQTVVENVYRSMIDAFIKAEMKEFKELNSKINI